MRASYATTYCLVPSSSELHPAILSVNWQLREEASHYLYGSHEFQFTHGLEPVIPFLDDMTATTRELIQSITLRKRGMLCVMESSDSPRWDLICQRLQKLPNLKKLRLILEVGLPRNDWEGPQTLAVSDLRLLYSTHHESLQWLRDLAGLKGLEQLEVIADRQPMAQPQTNSMLIFAALSNSIETSLVDFLRTDLGLPATSPPDISGAELEGGFDTWNGR